MNFAPRPLSNSVFAIVPVLLMLGLGGCASDEESDAPAAEAAVVEAPLVEATGALIIDGERIKLANAIIEPTRTGLSVSLTDRPLPEHCVGAMASMALFETGNYYSAVDFSIPFEDGPARANAVVNGAINYLRGLSVFSGTHEVTRADGVARGTIQERGEVDGREVVLEVDYAVTMNAAGYVSKPTISGKTGEPVSAYRASIHAFFDGDLETLREIGSEETVERLNQPEVLADPVGTARSLIAMADMMFPQRIAIDEIAVDGDTATLTVSGESGQCGLPTERATGTVQMVREDDRWKIDKESWEASTES